MHGPYVLLCHLCSFSLFEKHDKSFFEELEAPQGVEPKAEGSEDVQIRNPRKAKILGILSTVGRRLIINPNTHATLTGLIWASIHFR